METVTITKCEPDWGDTGCPFERESHCGIDGTNTSREVPADCPLRKSPMSFQLSCEVLIGQG